MRSPSILAGRVTLQARPTFCFSRKQFTTFCKEMSLLPMTTCLHRKRALGKEQLLGSTLRPVPTHMATPSCIATLHQVNWTTVRKQPTFFTTTTGFPVKWRLREMTAEISFWWGANTQFWVVLLTGRELRENHDCNQKHYSDLSRVGNFCSNFQTSFCGETSGGVPKFWLLSQATIEIVVANQNLDDRSQGKGLNLHWILQHKTTWVDYQAQNSVLF